MSVQADLPTEWPLRLAATQSAVKVKTFSITEVEEASLDNEDGSPSKEIKEEVKELAPEDQHKLHRGWSFWTLQRKANKSNEQNTGKEKTQKKESQLQHQTEQKEPETSDQQIGGEKDGNRAAETAAGENEGGTAAVDETDKSEKGTLPATAAADSYLAGLQLVGSFDTVEQFWAHYNHLTRPNSLPTSSDLHLFRDGIAPMWEDEKNKGGGRWVLRFRKGLANVCWENLVLAAVGEQLCDGALNEEVCGVAVSVRWQEDIISIWCRHADDNEIKRRTLECIKKALSGVPHQTPEFKPHGSPVALSAGRRTGDRNTGSGPRAGGSSGWRNSQGDRGNNTTNNNNNARRTGVRREGGEGMRVRDGPRESEPRLRENERRPREGDSHPREGDNRAGQRNDRRQNRPPTAPSVTGGLVRGGVPNSRDSEQLESALQHDSRAQRPGQTGATDEGWREPSNNKPVSTPGDGDSDLDWRSVTRRSRDQ